MYSDKTPQKNDSMEKNKEIAEKSNEKHEEIDKIDEKISGNDEKHEKIPEKKEKILEKPEKTEKQVKIIEKPQKSPEKPQKSPEKLQKSPEKVNETPQKPLETPQKPIILSFAELSDLYEDSLELFLLNYFSTVPQRFKSAFFSDVTEIIAKSTAEDLNFLQFTDSDSGKCIGLAILHIDKNFLLFKRMSLLHISLTEDSNALLSDALSLLLQWIWTRDNSEEIRVNLYHTLNHETNELELAKPLQQVFTAKGFRWKLLTNDRTSDTRYTTFGLRRNGDEFPAPEMQSEPIIFKSCCILIDNELGDKKSIKPTEEIYDNSNCQLNALTLCEELKEEGLSNSLLGLLLALKDLPNFTMPGMKGQKFEGIKELKGFLKENKFEEVEKGLGSNDTQQGTTVCSLLKTCYRWENFRTLKREDGKGGFVRIVPVRYFF